MHNDDISQQKLSRFESTLARHKEMLYRVCRRYCRQNLTVDDMMQEIALTLWQKRYTMERIPQGLQLKAWIWKVARNAAISLVRKSRVQAPMERVEEIEHDVGEEENLLSHQLHENIALLDEPDRTIVNLTLEGYSYAEIAKMTDLTVKNVSVRLVRAKNKLKDLMKDD